MKSTLFLVASLWLSLCSVLAQSTAELINIKDQNFAKAIRRNCFDCISLDNTLLPPAAKLTRLDVKLSNIHSLEGIQHFINLDTLDCSNNPLHRLPDTLPMGIKYMFTVNDSLDSLPALPTLLVQFDCSFNQLDSLPSLPFGLKKLICKGNKLTRLPTLLDNIIDLDCSYNVLKTIDLLPDSIRSLTCSGNKLTRLTGLRITLLKLDASRNLLNALPDLPYRTREVNLSFNRLKDIPGLPDSLIDFNCSHNKINEMPPLYDQLRRLDCSYNALINLPRLPKSLRYFDCRSNILVRMPKFPYNLEQLYASNNELLDCFINKPDLMQSDTFLPACGRRIFEKISITEGKIVTDREVNLVPYRKGTKWGYSTFEGNVIIPPQYDEVKFFTNRKECLAPFAIITIAGKKGIMDDLGEYVLEPAYDQVECNDFYGYVARMEDSKHWFFVTPEGFVVEDTLDKIDLPKFGQSRTYPARLRDDTYRNSVNPLIVNVNGKASFSLRRKYRENLWEFSDTIMPLHFDSLVFTQPFTDSLIARKEGKWGIIDFKEKTALPFEYDSIGQDIYKLKELDTLKQVVQTTFFRVKKDALGWGVWNSRAGFTIPPLFDSLQLVYVPDDVFLVNGTMPKVYFKVQDHNKKWGLMNAQSEWEFPCQYDEIYAEAGSGFVLRNGTQHGFFILQNRKIVPPQYKAVRCYVKGLIYVQTSKNLTGYVDENGNEFFDDSIK